MFLILGIIASPTSPLVPSVIIKFATARFMLLGSSRTLVGRVTGT